MKSKYSIEERQKIRKEYMKIYSKKYEKENKDRISRRKKEYYLNNKNKIDERNKGWHKKNKKKFRDYLDKYYLNPDNVEKRKQISAEWYSSVNKKNYRKYKRGWENQKRKSDPEYRIKKLLRLRVNQAFKKYSKTGKIRKSKDYEINYERILEKLTKTLPIDYSENKYHIDHIKPLCSFDLTNPKEVKEAFAPENHQWLTAEENLSKISEDLKVSLKKNNH